jgi:biopolymer transport protein ExbD
MAGFAQSEGDDEVIAAINIIPFVDIVLVLLIIFMVTSTAIVRASLKVELPKAASAGDAVESTINIVLTKEEALFVDGESTTPAGLEARVRGVAAGNPKAQAVIAADQQVAYGKVVGVIDLVKKNGIKTFALNIERELAPGRMN